MKKPISMALSLILITSLFAGCGQDTPGVSMPAETPAPAPAAEVESYQLPKKFTGEWTGVDGFLHVTADASIETPYGLKMPTATVKKKQISQADADKLLNLFLGDAQLYENSGKKAARTLKEGTYALHNCYAETDIGKIDVSIRNPETDGSSVLFSLEHYANLMAPNTIPAETPPVISQEEAIQTADALLARLGLTHYLCQDAAAVTFWDGNSDRYEEDGTGDPFGEELGGGYDLFYVPSVGGIPAVITGGNGSSTPDNEHIESIWPYESISISVNDRKQVVFFEWESPQEIPEVENVASKLLPFQAIADAFPDLIMTANLRRSEVNAINGFDVYDEFQVDKVELNFMRIRDKYNCQEGTYIPVWDFWATTSSHTEEEAYLYINDMEPRHEIVLTINALDGTIIDRKLGY